MNTSRINYLQDKLERINQGIEENRADIAKHGGSHKYYSSQILYLNKLAQKVEDELSTLSNEVFS